MKKPKIKWTPVDSMGVVGCVLLSALAAWIGFFPIWQRHTNYLDQQQDLQSQKEESAHQETALRATEKHLNLTETQLEKVPLHLKATSQLNERLASVTDLAAQSRLRIEDITPGSTTKGKRYDSVAIHLAGEGTYPNCAAFLHRLKETMPDIGIRTLHIYSQGATDDEAKFALDLQWFAAPTPTIATVQ